jgi:dTDP-4-amino-4,6-dideoxygalactose transaminase
LLLAQFEERDAIQSKRRRIWEYYHERLAEVAGERGIQRPTVPAECEQAYHMYYLLLPSLESRQSLMAQLAARGIATVFHYLPLHLSDMGRSLGGAAGDCPVTEDVSDRLLRLPFHNTLTEAEQAEVVEAIYASELGALHEA